MKFEEEEFICLDEEQERKREEELAEASSNGIGTYPINGIKVKFPFKPYPSQIGMMDRVIRALDGNKQHALLESPTGSGKTMALLCGVLAWMEEQRRKHNIDQPGPSTLIPEGSSPDTVLEEPEVVSSYFDKRVKKEVFVIEDEMDLDFVDAKDKSSCSNCPSNTIPTPKEKSFDSDSDDAKFPPEKEQFHMPKIYFASRTHKQLAQSIRELKRSGYQAKFTVLASRGQYCVNGSVRKENDLNEACKLAMNPDAPGGRCMYSNKLQKFFEAKRAFTTNMDIEDLISFGKQRRLCPYFLAREAAQYSEIIMCPYNYLIEPMIRQAMGIDLEGAVVIVDEAHNIEDVCRSAGSFEWSQENVFSIEIEIKTFFARASEDPCIVVIEPEAHQALLHVCTTVLNWIGGVSNFGSSSTTATNKYQSFETKIDIFEGQDIINELLKLGITQHTVEKWAGDLAAIEEATRKMMSQKLQESSGNDRKRSSNGLVEEKILSSGSCRILSGFFFTLQNIFYESNSKIDSFRLVKYSTFKMIKSEKREEIVMGFWCLSSDVIFKPIAAQARAIILTSGTLSPMDTFASELHTNFPLQLEANHVIDNSQIFVGVFPRGPSGAELIGTFQNTSSFNFQDDISQSIYDICKVTPFGVLCFFPSYALLEKVLERMQRTGKYKELLQIKEAVIEPRAGPAEDFEKIIKHYYKTISDCKKSPTGTTTVSTRPRVTGAIFFAVYRGKVSEGLDFADEYARAVINVGIPYPAFKDPKVTLKKEYNDRNTKAGSLLPGMAWYETQAFRALNQALGRCIRHRKDWGAVIFLDQRFTSPRNVQKLSKWVRPSVRNYQGFNEGIEALRLFMKGKDSIKLPEEHWNTIELDGDEEDHTSTVKSVGRYFSETEPIELSSDTYKSKTSTFKASNATNSFFNRRGKTLGSRGKRPFI